MKGHRPTYRELEEANVSLTDAVTRLNFKMDRIIEEKCYTGTLEGFLGVFRARILPVLESTSEGIKFG